MGSLTSSPLRESAADTTETETVKSVMKGKEIFRTDYPSRTIGSVTLSGEIR